MPRKGRSDDAVLHSLGIATLGAVVGFVLLGGVGFPIGMIVAGVPASLVLIR